MGWWGKREEGGTLRCLQVDNENCGGGGVGGEDDDHVDNDGCGDDGGGEDDDHNDNDGVDAQAGV